MKRLYLLLISLICTLVAVAQVPVKTVRLRADSIYFMKPLFSTANRILVVDSVTGKVGYAYQGQADLSGYATIDSPTFTGISAWLPVTVDSSDIDVGGITDLHTQIIYNDTHDCWSDWTSASGPQIKGGSDGQRITIKSISSGRLYLRNNDATGDTLPAFVMFNGDNITLEYINDTWIEVNRTDFNQEPAGVTPGTTMIYPGTGLAVSNMSSWGTSIVGNDGDIAKKVSGQWTAVPDTVGGGADTLTKGYGIILNDNLANDEVIGSSIVGVDTSKIATVWDVANGSDSIITAGVISSLPEIDDNPGSNISAAAWIQAMYYKTVNPAATLSGGVTIEKRTSGTYTPTLNWTARRELAGAPIAYIIVDGVGQSFTPPAAGATVSGTKVVTVTYNTDVTFTNIVSSNESPAKTATATTPFYFRAKGYYGRCNSAVPISATIISVTGGNAIQWATVKAATVTVTASGSNYVYYAYPSSLGALTSIMIGGFESILTFTPNTISVTNASGYVQDYKVYVSNNTFSADITMIIQ